MLCRTSAKIVDVTRQNCPKDFYLRVVSLCNSKSLKEGVGIHSPIIKLGLLDELYINNNLLSLYAKCFGPDHARQFFDEMPFKDVVSWTGILSAYTKNERHEDALDIFDSMMLSGSCPNEFTFSNVLRSCSALEEFSHGKRIHASIIKHGFEKYQILASNLIDLYSKFGCTEEACRLFSHMEDGDTVSWTTMISCFLEAREWSRAIRLYMSMLRAGVSPNEFTFAKLLAAPGIIGLSCGRLVHAHLIIFGVEINLVVKTALVDMYSKCRSMKDAIRVSKLTPEYDVFLWTTVISGLAVNSMFREAAVAFQEMKASKILPSNFTYSCLLNACSSMQSLGLGRQIHLRVIIAGLENDVSVGNALVDMYMKCSCNVGDGFRAFAGIKSPNVISWTSLTAGFARHGHHEDCFNSFMEMKATGVQPNSFTLSIMLRACNAAKSAVQMLKLHGYIIKTNADQDIIVSNALVDAYAGSGMVDDAWHVVRNMSERDAITYTCLATRLNQMGFHKSALNIVSLMFNDDIKMDGFSLATFLSASAGLGKTETGKQLHSHSVKTGLVGHTSVSNGLVDLYGKCGLVHDARRAFADINEPDVVSWNGLISGLALNGHVSSALSAFDDMKLAGVQPDSVTFLSALYACRRGGLVDLGIDYFHTIGEMQDIESQLDHYACLVDLLGRAGRLEEAVVVLETMPFRPNSLIYKTMLTACKVHRNLPLGEDMARRGLDLDPSDLSFHMLLANLYDDCGRSDLGEQTLRSMRLRKQSGQVGKQGGIPWVNR